MPFGYRVLGQAALVAATDTDVYTVPAATAVVLSGIAVVNRGAATSYRVAIRPNGAVLADAHYVAYDVALPANTTHFLPAGMTVDAADVVTVRSAAGSTVSASVFGSEIT